MHNWGPHQHDAYTMRANAAYRGEQIRKRGFGPLPGIDLVLLFMRIFAIGLFKLGRLGFRLVRRTRKQPA